MNYTATPAEVLDKVLNSGQISQSQAKRLGVIRSLFFEEQGRSHTARTQGVSLPFVDRWKKRWTTTAQERRDWFSSTNAEARSCRADRNFIFSLVADAARSGAPAKFSEATRAQIVAIALQKPSERGVPIEKWSQELLATHLIEQGIVDYISSSTVSDFLKSARRNSPPEYVLRMPADR